MPSHSFYQNVTICSLEALQYVLLTLLTFLLIHDQSRFPCLRMNFCMHSYSYNIAVSKILYLPLPSNFSQEGWHLRTVFYSSIVLRQADGGEGGWEHAVKAPLQYTWSQNYITIMPIASFITIFDINIELEEIFPVGLGGAEVKYTTFTRIPWIRFLEGSKISHSCRLFTRKRTAKLQWAWGGARSSPVSRVNKPKKMGTHRTRARSAAKTN